MMRNLLATIILGSISLAVYATPVLDTGFLTEMPDNVSAKPLKMPATLL
jgi:hypothetical protein